MGMNKIYIFFIALALTFWNPLTYYLLYKNTPVIVVRGIFIFYSIVFILGLTVVYLLHKKLIPQKLKNPLLSISIAGILFALLVLVNAAIGKEEPKEKEGLIFVPGTEVRYKSVEFDYRVSINSLGLRDREFNINKGDKFRIICLGDWMGGEP
jgi:hypothetical protein